jgi:hypothetical protein
MNAHSDISRSKRLALHELMMPLMRIGMSTLEMAADLGVSHSTIRENLPKCYRADPTIPRYRGGIPVVEGEEKVKRQVVSVRQRACEIWASPEPTGPEKPFMSNLEAMQRYKIVLPAPAVEAEYSIDGDVAQRSREKVTDLVVMDFFAAGHKIGDGERPPKMRVTIPKRIFGEPLSSGAGSPMASCAEIGGTAVGGRGWAFGPKTRPVTLPYVSIQHSKIAGELA